MEIKIKKEGQDLQAGGKGNVKSEAFNLEGDDKSSQKGDSSDRQFSSLLTKSLFFLALEHVS